MSTKAWSVLFQLSEPAFQKHATVLNNESQTPTLGFERLVVQLSEDRVEDSLSMSGSRSGAVETWIASTKLSGLFYVGEQVAVLGCKEIREALADMGIAFDRLLTSDFSYWYFDDLSMADALLAPDDELSRLSEPDNEHPYYFILYLRDHERQLRKALENHHYLVYLRF